MINKDGGGDNFWILWGGHICYEGGIELMGVPPVPPLGKTLLLVVIVYSKLVKYPWEI